jgi:hypothetical protein
MAALLKISMLYYFNLTLETKVETNALDSVIARVLS